MASPTSGRTTSPIDDERTFPSPELARSEAPPSVMSSRMTDIVSDDGGDTQTQKSAPSQAKGGDKGSRPTTGRTITSQSTRNKKFTSGLNTKRTSIGGTTAPGSSAGRTGSMTSRSHVPSITSNAFFRPMSSQRLQAQRGGNARTSIVGQQLDTQQPLDLDDGATDLGGSVVPMQQQSPTRSDGIEERLPSRGTEMTEQDTYGRITANTSPTQGHNPASSMSDSVRPLNKKSDGNRNHLTVGIDKSYKDRTNIPSPIKSPRSFRSSFLMPGKSEHDSRNRSTDGAEKLSSAASSPGFRPVDSQGRPRQHASQLQKPEPNVGQVFEYFEGNTRFFMKGRWQNSKQQPINIITGIFIIIPAPLFFVFEASWHWHNISPAIPIVFAYIYLVCISSFIHASVSDPGILPRHLHPFPPINEEDDPLRVSPPSNDWTMIKSAEKGTAAMEVPVKHCRTCDIWRPPRAHHCRLCDNCIETHDHHCVWLNNCVGKRNYRYFFAFISSGTLVAAYLVAVSLVQLLTYMNDSSVSFGDAISHFPVVFALVILGFVLFCYPAALMGYHIFLMVRGETTREYINSHKFNKEERYRPFSQRGVFKNLNAVLCRPKPPTYYGFKTKYQPGDQRLGDRRSRRPRKNSQGLEMQDVKPAGEQGFQGPTHRSS